jgi:hypothetical protein
MCQVTGANSTNCMNGHALLIEAPADDFDPLLTDLLNGRNVADYPDRGITSPREALARDLSLSVCAWVGWVSV